MKRLLAAVQAYVLLLALVFAPAASFAELRAASPGLVGTVLCKQLTAVAAPSDITEDTLFTCTVPANALGANGYLRITTYWTTTSSANAKTLRVRFSGGAGTNCATFPAFTTVAAAGVMTTIANRNATNSQVCGSIMANTSGANFGTGVATAAVDTTAATTALVTCQKALNTETCQLEMAVGELFTAN